MASGEAWRPVVGFEGLYEVSDLGRVRNVRTGFIKRPSTKINARYKLMGLSRGGHSRSYSLHRLVTDAFLGPCPRGMERCHLNGNPEDNRLANLSYATRKENHSHKLRHGTVQRGERHSGAKLTESVVSELRATTHTNADVKAAAEKLGVFSVTVYSAVTGRTWRHLPGARPIARPAKSKFTEESVRYIRAHRGKKTKRQLANEFGVSPFTIGNIWSRRVWAHVA